MKRLIRLVPVLFMTCFFAQTALTALAFDRIDLRFENFAALLIVPAAQGALLAWAWRERGATSPREILDALRQRQPLPGILLLLDCAILVSAWLLGGGAASNPATKLPTYYSGVKAVAAGGLLALLARKRPWSGGDKGWLLLFSAGLVGFGVDCLTGWLEPLAVVIMPGWQLLFRWLVFYGLLFAGSLLVLFKTQTAWSRISKPAAATVDWAVAFAMLAAIVVVTAFFNKPYLTAPWSTLVKTCGVLFVTSILLGCIQLTGGALQPANAAGDRR